MKNRFCRMGKTLLGAACLLSTCGVTYSCSDDFDLDEKRPSMLGEGIYDDLKSRQDRKFTTVIRLIDDLGYREVLSRTGSKTLFVADDEAFGEFFKNNSWKDGNGNPVTSYEQLSTSQKRLLLNGTMLNNAYVLEMLTTLQGPIKNLCLRRLNSVAATDSVPYFKWDELPNNLNEPQLDDKGNVLSADKRFWDRYRQQSKGGMYLALDKTLPMMTHFLEGQLKEKQITNADVAFIINDPTLKDEESARYVYDAKIVEADKVCQNGYYHVLNKVMLTPQNMAEVIRTNGETSLFSLLLDRFSAPFYDKALTEEYKALQEIKADSVYQKLYISQRSQKGNITEDTDGKPLGDFPSLSYDPGWNAYATSGVTSKEQDMAAMFVPSDEAMKQYFLYGAGAMLIKRYSPNRPNDEANLEYNLYQIPLNIVRPLVANLMKDSFNESVPSKYRTIMNDAQDQMFSYNSVDEYKSFFKKVLLANNGVVYVMNGVIAPATYSSVMAPVLYDKGSQVMNTILHADDAFINTNYGSAPLRKFYSTYLLAMQSNFSFFVPTDEALSKFGYIDPISLAGKDNKNRFWTFVPEAITASGNFKRLAIRATPYRYYVEKPVDPESARPATGIKASPANDNLEDSPGNTKANLLTEMVDQHILIHDVERELETSKRQYFLSRSGAPVFVKNRPSDMSLNGKGMKVNGGMQLVLNGDEEAANDFDCEVLRGNDMTRESNGNYGNGMTYFIDRALQPTPYNVFQIFQKNADYSKFRELCMDLSGSSNLVTELFVEEGMSKEDADNQQKKFLIFGADRHSAMNTQLIRFFNNYRYTIFVPSNEAVERALANGLPTIKTIQEYVDANKNEEGVIKPEAKDKARAMLVTYINFVKYHFCDQSLFVDNCQAETSTQSACVDAITNSFIRLTVNQTPNSISVKDASGRAAVAVDNSLPFNQLARDFVLDKDATSANKITSSSYVVMHGLKDYLLYDAKLTNGFAAAWETPAVAKAFVKKYCPKN